MEITGLGWCGTRTGRGGELAHFYEHVLGLRLVHTEADFWVFELPDGRHVEIFGSSYPGKEYSLPARFSASPFGSVVRSRVTRGTRSPLPGGSGAVQRPGTACPNYGLAVSSGTCGEPGTRHAAERVVLLPFSSSQVASHSILPVCRGEWIATDGLARMKRSFRFTWNWQARTIGSQESWRASVPAWKSRNWPT